MFPALKSEPDAASAGSGACATRISGRTSATPTMAANILRSRGRALLAAGRWIMCGIPYHLRPSGAFRGQIEIAAQGRFPRFTWLRPELPCLYVECTTRVRTRTRHAAEQNTTNCTVQCTISQIGRLHLTSEASRVGPRRVETNCFYQLAIHAALQGWGDSAAAHHDRDAGAEDEVGVEALMMQPK